MRLLGFATMTVCVWTLATFAQEPPPVPARFGVDSEVRNYPQTTPKDTLKSVVAVIDRKRYTYLLAHLAEPGWVDQRMKETGVTFEQLAKEVGEKITNDPESLKEMRKFLKEGEWKDGDGSSVCTHKDIKDKVVRMIKKDERWFLVENNKP